MLCIDIGGQWYRVPLSGGYRVPYWFAFAFYSPVLSNNEAQYSLNGLSRSYLSCVHVWAVFFPSVSPYCWHFLFVHVLSSPLITSWTWPDISRRLYEDLPLRPPYSLIIIQAGYGIMIGVLTEWWFSAQWGVYLGCSRASRACTFPLLCNQCGLITITYNIW